MSANSGGQMVEEIIFLGTGTSQGVPVIACDCHTCTSPDPRDNRTRSSILVRVAGKYFLIDSGPDMRTQLLRERVKSMDAVLLTHKHKDHIAGLDDIRAFNFRQQAAMPVYADALTASQLKNEFPYIFDGSNYPGIPQVDLQVIDEQPFEVQGVPITPVLVYHFKMPVTSYRIGDFCYITDANRIPEASMERLRGTRILVINALRKETHISHFNLQQALEVAAAINPEVTYLIHMSHHMGRHAEVEPELPPNVFFSYDGLRVRI